MENKADVIKALRAILVLANASDSDNPIGEGGNDLPADCASQRHLYGTICKALELLGMTEEEYHEYVEGGEWPEAEKKTDEFVRENGLPF